MSIVSVLKVAMNSILSNKLRTLLTMLGVIIGVASVIALVSIGQGTTSSIKSSIESMGSNLIMVNIIGRGEATSLTYEQAAALAELEGVGAVSPMVNGSATIKYGTNSMDVSVEGVDYHYMGVRNRTMVAGHAISGLDVDNRLKTVVLGTEVVSELFGTNNPIGEKISINGEHFTVNGVLAESSSSMMGSNNEVVLMPISTAQRFLSSAGVRSIYVQAVASERVSEAMVNIEEFLAGWFKADEDAYRLTSAEDMLSTMSDISNTMSMLLGGIASISLLVGGIGIMNIMMVSVTERTREIGIRKAIGAKRRDILVQFLIEAAVISGVGGIIGVLVGCGAAILVKSLGMTTVISAWIVVLAVLFSMAIGVFFGIYPANRAARLNPVDALRSE